MSEVQIVDALIDYMRDLMVIKSAGIKTELVILSADQKKKAADLAEKFDVAGLVYNITSLEKLRWPVKNTDTPRALLEAGILRFALSEHFLNIDTLVAQQGGNLPQPLKKKSITAPDTSSNSTVQPPADSQPQSSLSHNLQSIKDNWQTILNALSIKLGKSAIGLLSGAQPTNLGNNILTLTFDASAQMNKKLCESNGRLEQIQAALGSFFGLPVTVKLELASTDTSPAVPAASTKMTSAQKADVINHPAVKTVLLGLDATVTGVDENSKQRMSMKTTLLTIVFITVSVSLIPGCESPLSDAQILNSANQYAVARGMQPEQYDISISPAGADVTAPESPQAPDFSKQVKSMSGADTRVVTYTPKSRRSGGAYAFYINKNTGKLVMVMKRK